MSVIGMIGPHAVGKTTALKRWQGRYGSERLKVFPLDSLRKQYPDNPAKVALVATCRADPAVCIIESARGFAAWLSVFTQTDPLLALTCPEPVGRSWMEHRRGGRPLSDYWTVNRLNYECNRHLLNWVGRLAGARHFVIEDRQRDWPVVDECFYQLFRKAWNGRAK